MQHPLLFPFSHLLFPSVNYYISVKKVYFSIKIPKSTLEFDLPYFISIMSHIEDFSNYT